MHYHPYHLTPVMVRVTGAGKPYETCICPRYLFQPYPMLIHIRAAMRKSRDATIIFHQMVLCSSNFELVVLTLELGCTAPQAHWTSQPRNLNWTYWHCKNQPLETWKVLLSGSRIVHLVKLLTMTNKVNEIMVNLINVHRPSPSRQLGTHWAEIRYCSWQGATTS